MLFADFVAGSFACLQPYINLATVVNSDSLEAQVGGAGNLAKLRSIKKQLDPTIFFTRHSFVGL